MNSKSVMMKLSELFKCAEKGTISSEDGDGGNINGTYDFITASAEWKKHSTYSHEKEAIIFAVAAGGSLGRTHYVNGKFSASNLCLILTPKRDSEYKVDLEFYNYYFAAIRKRLVSDLADGTSKLTIRPQDLGEYYIEYIDYNKQKEYVKNNVHELNNIRQQYKEKIEAAERNMNSLL
jgi:restriction endonuclease S subunit